MLGNFNHLSNNALQILYSSLMLKYISYTCIHLLFQIKQLYKTSVYIVILIIKIIDLLSNAENKFNFNHIIHFIFSNSFEYDVLYTFNLMELNFLIIIEFKIV